MNRHPITLFMRWTDIIWVYFRYAPGVDILTVVILPSEEMDSLNDEQVNIGDLVALTDIDSL